MYLKPRQKGMGKLGFWFPKRLKVGSEPVSCIKVTGSPQKNRELGCDFQKKAAHSVGGSDGGEVSQTH